MKHLDVPGLGPVARVGLGTWQFGSREWGYGDAYADTTARAIVGRALELGVTLFDTAEIYGTGRSERILGDALGASRGTVQVATKLFPVAPFAPVVRRRAEGSARRLQLREIALYQVHWPNPLVPDSVIMKGIRGLLDDQVIRTAGVSNYSLDRWQAADAALGQPLISNQVQFSLARPGALDDLVPFAEREQRMILAWSPLAQGLLGGRYDADHRPGGVRAGNPLFGTENLRRAQPLIDLLRDVAKRHEATPSQVALAWLLAQPRVVVIPGASSVDQLNSNLAAADLDLEPDSVAELTAVAQAFRPVGLGRTLLDRVREKVRP